MWVAASMVSDGGKGQATEMSMAVRKRPGGMQAGLEAGLSAVVPRGDAPDLGSPILANSPATGVSSWSEEENPGLTLLCLAVENRWADEGRISTELDACRSPSGSFAAVTDASSCATTAQHCEAPEQEVRIASRESEPMNISALEVPTVHGKMESQEGRDRVTIENLSFRVSPSVEPKVSAVDVSNDASRWRNTVLNDGLDGDQPQAFEKLSASDSSSRPTTLPLGTDCPVETPVSFSASFASSSPDTLTLPSGTNKVKGPWRPEEDTLLIDLVAKYGPRRWTQISSFIPGRTGKQTRERWLNQLSPGLSKRPWSQEEDQLILREHAKLGNRWSEISKLLDGRTDNAVKNRFNTTIRRQISQLSERSRGNKPSTQGGSENSDKRGPAAAVGGDSKRPKC